MSALCRTLNRLIMNALLHPLPLHHACTLCRFTNNSTCAALPVRAAVSHLKPPHHERTVLHPFAASPTTQPVPPCLCMQLLYTAEMKRPITEPYESKVAVVEEVLQKLALDKCK